MIILHACARGKVIGSVVIVAVVVVNKKNLQISTSRHLSDLQRTSMINLSNFGENLTSLCFESNGMAYKHHIFVGHPLILPTINLQ